MTILDFSITIGFEVHLISFVKHRSTILDPSRVTAKTNNQQLKLKYVFTIQTEYNIIKYKSRLIYTYARVYTLQSWCLCTNKPTNTHLKVKIFYTFRFSLNITYLIPSKFL